MGNHIISSENIFKDSVFSNPDEELAKVKLSSKIDPLITDQEASQREAPGFLAISRLKITPLRI